MIPHLVPIQLEPWVLRYCHNDMHNSTHTTNTYMCSYAKALILSPRKYCYLVCWMLVCQLLLKTGLFRTNELKKIRPSNGVHFEQHSFSLLNFNFKCLLFKKFFYLTFKRHVSRFLSLYTVYANGTASQSSIVSE